MLLETIRVEHGRAWRLERHHERMQRSAGELGFNAPSWGELRDAIDRVLEGRILPDPGRYKVRLIYREKILQVKAQRYAIPHPLSAVVVEAGELAYRHKLADRAALNELQATVGPHSVVIFARDGLLTDCLYANLVADDGRQWLTPKSPLLPGVMRAELLESGRMQPADIPAAELHEHSRLLLINALLDPGEVTIRTSAVEQRFAASAPKV